MKSFGNIKKRRLTILIRCDGSASIGLGHVVRCLALAEPLRAKGARVIFAVRQEPAAVRRVRRAGFRVEGYAGETAEHPWIDRLIARYKPQALILDIRTGLSRRHLRRWRDSGIRVVVIDDSSDRKFEADLGFYPPTLTLTKAERACLKGRIYSGWDWVILRKEFQKKYPRKRNKIPRVLVTMGGSDPKAFTLTTLKILDSLRDTFNTDVVLGPAFTQEKELSLFSNDANRPYRILRGVKNMAALMAKADLAIASFGMTAYELAAMGVPAVYLCLSTDHERSASVCHKAGIAINLGVYAKKKSHKLLGLVQQLLRDHKDRRRMAMKAKRTNIARGAEKIAGIIVRATRGCDEAS